MRIYKRFQFLIILKLCFLLPYYADCQEVIQVWIHPDGTLYVHSGETISIFSDISNAGSFASAKNSKINFWGERWNSKTGSTMPDESSSGVDGTGGNFIFARKVSASQYLSSSNNLQSNSGFPNISIANSQNIILEGSDLLIRNNLNFESGHLILNDRNTIMGVNSTISGYNKNSYVVTGTGTNGGFLVRNTSGQQQGAIVFPVGTTVSSYTPASLTYTGISQNLKVRVFENLFDKAIFGIPDNVYSVKKTWHFSMSNTDPNAIINFNMQHNNNDEGSQFAIRQAESFVSRFQVNTDNWDISSATGVSAGVITSADPIPNAFVSSRTNISGLSLNEYFSKSVIKEDAILGLRIPAGISPNNDGLNDRFVIENLKLSDKVRIEIYNSGQHMVYKDTNYKNTFEGISNQNGQISDNLPDGIYYYIININDGKAYKGYIVINR